ncbi:hypothetical protein WG74_06045 [Citromicrobium sp. JL477]|nr:hypothetical protein WG74_06045 [Citromicrobium sp. JL477]
MPSSQTKPKGKPVGAVLQAVRLLRALSDADAPMGVSAAARAANINTSTAFNVLRTLTAETLTVFDETTKTYSLGPGLLDLSRTLRQPALADRLRAELPELAAQTGRLIALWEFTGTRVILIDRAQSNRPVRLDLDLTQRMPRYLGAIGRAAAAADQLGKAALKKEFGKLRWAGNFTLEDYIQSVDSARELGYGVDRTALYEGIVAIASAVTDADGQPVFGLSAIEFAEGMSDEDIAQTGELLADVARRYSAS